MEVGRASLAQRPIGGRCSARTYDLTGLPPTPEDVAAFEARDIAATRYEKLVDRRLLASPHYGEQWGRHWLDVVRYADTAGENSDHPLAARLALSQLGHRRVEPRPALRPIHPRTDRRRSAGADGATRRIGRSRHRYRLSGHRAAVRPRHRKGHPPDLEDTLDTLGKSVLGLSIGCCRCHDHKYDPLSRATITACTASSRARSSPSPAASRNSSRATLYRCPPSAPNAATPAVAYAVAEGVPHNTRLQRPGRAGRPGPESPRSSRRARRPEGPGDQDQRPAGAGAVVDRSHKPLTARVIVNRVWHWHFGRGLVMTPNDFGTRGAQTDAPRTPRRSGESVHRVRMEPQGPPPRDPAQCDLPASVDLVPSLRPGTTPSPDDGSRPRSCATPCSPPVVSWRQPPARRIRSRPKPPGTSRSTIRSPPNMRPASGAST